LCTIKNPLNGSIIIYSASNLILISVSGNCSFVKKAINAQKIGAKMAIIIDDIAENKKVIQADDGNGKNVHIPVIFINTQNGTSLL
jgi:glutaredoxin